MLRNLFNTNRILIAISIYLITIAINVQFSKYFDFTNIMEWWINTFIFYTTAIVCIITFKNKLRKIYKLGLTISIWLIHAIFTAPAAFLLGILKFDPNHIRTQGEHRAVFVLASLPILFYLMQKSKIFITKK